MPEELVRVLQKTAELLGFSPQPLMRFKEKYFQREKTTQSAKKALLKSEVRGEWSDWLGMETVTH